MAQIFKYSAQSNKGIIVFTHKEWGFFSGVKGVRTLKRQGKWPQWLPGKELRTYYYQNLLELKKMFFIGVHFGHYYPYEFKSILADFVISGHGTLPNLDSKIFRIPLNSRNFTPKYFTNLMSEKIWDILTIGMNVKVKNYSLIFKSIKQVLSLKPSTTFLLIIPSQQGIKIGIHSTIAREFYSIFSRLEQQQITFLYLHPELEYGINQRQLVEFYNRSRLFTLFSQKEGESRVISEALCCGIPVVVYSNLLGGGRDLLTEQNSVMFDEYDKAHEAWFGALDTFPQGITDQPEKLIREDYSIDTLTRDFSELFKLHGYEFDGQLENTDQLDQRLPAHFYDVPWKIDPKKPTADILSKKQFEIFLNILKIYPDQA